MKKAEALEQIRAVAEKVTELRQVLLDIHVEVYRDSLLDAADYARACVNETEEAFSSVLVASGSIWKAVHSLDKEDVPF